MAAMKKAVHFGAGNIGRGFLGQLYSQAGWETVFVDVNETVINALNRRNEYTLEIAEVPARTMKITNVRGVKGTDIKAIARELVPCDLVSTAVGARALPAVARTIGQALENRAAWRIGDPLDILICENLHHASQPVRQWLLEGSGPIAHQYVQRFVGLVETVIGRMIPVVPPEKAAQDPLYVKAEAFGILPVDAKAFRGDPPKEIRGFEFSDRLPALEARKLYSHNCGHALTAYFGYLQGHDTLARALADKELNARVRAGMDETARALVAAFSFTKQEMDEHIEDLLRRFANEALGDTVLRVGRDPARKLAREDRLVGAARLCLAHGVDPVTVCAGIRAAFRFDPPGDEGAAELQAMLKSGGAEEVLRKVCGLTEDDPLWQRLADDTGRRR